MIDTYKGSKVAEVEDARLPFNNRGDGAPLYTDKAKYVVLESGESLFACGIGDCDHYSDTIQGVINRHLGSAHPEVVTYKPKGAAKAVNADMLDMTLRELLDLAQAGATDNEFLHRRLAEAIDQRNQAIADKRAAQRELDNVQNAARRLLGGIR